MGRALVLSCEHATAFVPAAARLGLGEGEGTGHEAWDRGSHELALAVALELGAPLLSGQVSRLVVDLNRSRSTPGAVPQSSFGLPVPGNWSLSSEDRTKRLAALHRPYRRSLRHEIRRALRRHGRVVHLSIHSFTPVIGGTPREVQVGVLFDPARAAESVEAADLVAALRQAGLDARPNEPYEGISDGATTWLRTRFPDPDYAGLELEVRDDLLPSRADEIARVVLGWAR